MKELNWHKAARGVAMVLALAAIGVAGHTFYILQHATVPEATPDIALPPMPPPLANSLVEPLTPAHWDVFRPGSRLAAGHSEGLRFRLAGTFFVLGGDVIESDAPGQRVAILDDLTAKRQHIVSEGRILEEHEIIRIYPERVIMRHDGQEIELTLSFSGPSSTASALSAVSMPDTVEGEEPPLEVTRFGQRISDTRWIIEREALVAYVGELMEDTDRAASIYMSMRADYDDEDEVAGYRIEMAGEQEFFKSVGLLEGDTIRMVNSMRMISQGRAEYFIGEFIQERLGAVVLDVERNGETLKLIYLMR